MNRRFAGYYSSLKIWPFKVLLKAIMKIKNIIQTLINASNRINETHMVWIQDQNCRLIFMIIKRILHSWSVLRKFIFWKEKCNVECIKCSLDLPSSEMGILSFKRFSPNQKFAKLACFSDEFIKFDLITLKWIFLYLDPLYKPYRESDIHWCMKTL